MRCGVLLADSSVDTLTNQVCMTQVLCVLANHVDQDLTNWGCLTRSGLSEIGNFIDALIAAGD